MKKVLSILLVALLVLGMIPAGAFNVSAAETTDVELSVLGTTGILASDKLSISWASNNVTFTNYKAGSSTAIRNSDSAHYRVYAKSEVEVSAPGNITKIVITSAGSSYNTPWVNSGKAVGTASNSGNAITIVPTTPAATIKFAATAQVRLTKIVVTYEVAGGDTGCAHANTTAVEAVAPSCEAPGFEAGTYCNDCESYIDGHAVIPATGHAYGEWIDVTAATCTEAGEQSATCANCGDVKTQTVAALGHNYVDSTCSRCGHVAVMSNYELVTDAASLKAGDQLIIVGKNASDAYSVMIPYVSGNNLKAESINAPVDGKISLPDTSAAAIITLGGDATGWTLFDGAKYLYAPGKASSNYLKAIAELPEDNTGAWTIAIDADGIATIVSVGNTGDGARNTIKFNYGNSPVLFACYKSDYTQNVSMVSIYRLATGESEEPEGCAHANTTTNTVDATCEAAGSTTVTCADCGEIVSTEEIPALGHSYVNNSCEHCGKEFEGEIDTPDPTTPSEPAPEAGYVLADSILVGDKIIIVSIDAGMELTSISTTSTKYGVGTAYTDAPAAAWEFTVVAGANEGTYALVDANGNYLNWATGSKNTLTTATELSANTSWSISIDENGYAHIKNAADSARQIWWNVQSPRFACYTGKTLETTGYYCPNIFKYTTGAECEHVWGEWVQTVAPSCTEAGAQVSTCTLCGAEQSGSIPATGHNYTYADGAMTCTCGDSVAFNTIAEAKAYTSTSQVYYLKGIVTYVQADKVYIEDATGAILVFFDKTVDTSAINLGDEMIVWDTMTKYNGLIETTYTLATEYMIVSSGNTLPLQTVTIADLLADTTNEYLAERVIVENVTIGVLGTNNTALTDANGNTINIYKLSGQNADITENDTVSVTAIVSSYNAYQLLVNPGTAATDIIEIASGEEEVIETVTIASALAGTPGEYYQVEGVITYISGRNVYIQDNTGAIVVYLTADAATAKVGDKVKAYGALKNYNGLLELDAVDETNVKFFEILSNDNTVEAQNVSIGDLLDDEVNAYHAEKVALNEVYVSYYSYNSGYGNVTYTLLDVATGETIKINRVTVASEADCHVAGSKVNLVAFVSKYVNDETDGNGYQLVTDNNMIEVLSVCAHETTEIVNKVDATCTTGGYTGDTQCTVCKYYVSRGEDVPVNPDNHNYVDGTCSNCGAISGPAIDESLAFIDVGLSLVDYIGVQPLLEQSIFANYDSYYVESVLELANGETKVTVLEPIDVLGWYFAYDMQLLPNNMTEQFTLTIYAEKDGVKYQSVPVVTTIKALAKTKLDEYKAADELASCRILVDMLNYGAEVQKAFAYNVDNLANTGMEAYADLGTAEAPAITKTVTTSGNGIAAVVDTLSLSSKVEFQFMFELTQIEGCEMRYTLGDNPTVTVPASEFINIADYYGVGFFALQPTQFRSDFTVGLYNSTTGEPVSVIYNGSAEGYAARSIANGENIELVTAMMKYGDAVFAVFGG